CRLICCCGVGGSSIPAPVATSRA
ncbi:MAG: hypothetical protein AVDCRST_MAG88-3147, partial [uncultured Thermomicrobiales bacterium]